MKFKKLISLSLLILGLSLCSCTNSGSSSMQTGLQSIEVQENSKKEYYVKDTFVYPQVIAYYGDQSTKDVSSSCDYTGFDSSTVGNKTVEVYYTEGLTTKTTSYVVTIKAKDINLTSIEVSNAKTTYEYGEAFVKPIVTAKYSNNSTKVVTEQASFTGFNSTQPGSQTIQVSYTEGQITKSTSYSVTVNSLSKTLDKIEVQSSSKTQYNYGEAFVKPVVKATFTDETTQDVSHLCTCEGYNATQAGDQIITVSVTYGDVTKTTTYTINVCDSLLKYAIFADVQLCNDVAIPGEAAANLGATANAPLALENHLRFCKAEGVSTILMNGDITNQANDHYYQYFESIVKKVYGTDESKWPEFVYNMGNHEWWGGITETESADAVTKFKAHARIESDNLIAQSNTPYYLNSDETLPSYYKVINGIPFMVISGDKSSGSIGDSLKNEINTWLTQIKNLTSVKAGGPIFVEYHYPLSTSMTHGQGSHSEVCSTIEEIFEDTPNAVIFTGDTHYPGISERSINQVDFTTINLGSSSYSRMVQTGATKMNNFDNIEKNGGKISDKMVGNLKFNEAYTPTIQIVNVRPNYSYSIDRYFSEENGTASKVGPTWEMPVVKSKSDFKYTNDRFQKVASAQALYNKDGLNWENTDQVKFGVNGNQVTVLFPDVIDYHYCEHYVIDINGQKFDEASNYYKNLDQKGNNYFICENVTSAANYTVTVTAYDFYDNPSTNTLTSSSNDPNSTIDPIDYQCVKTYCDIQTRNRFDDVSTEKDSQGNSSKSSVEYYYKGIQTYNAGAILNRVYSRSDSTVSCKNYVSLSNNPNIHPTLRIDAKNLSSSDVIFGLSIIKWNGEAEQWKADFSKETQQTVSGSDWTTLYWDLSAFGISCKDELAGVTLKAKSKGASSSGYDMDVLIDNVDIIDEPPIRGKKLVAGVDNTTDLDNIAINETFSFDVMFTSEANTYINVMLGRGWSNYFGYYKIFANYTLADTYNGVSIADLGDGYHRVTFTLSSLTKFSGTKPTDYINLCYVRGSDSTASGYISINY